MIIVLLGSFFFLLVIGVPIAFCLGISSLVYLIGQEIPLVLIAQKMYAGLDVFVLLCIPGFILAGNLMNAGGITDKIIDFCNSLVGHIRGGLGLTNVSGSMLFAGISGTAVADTASLGSIMIPAMKKNGYDVGFAAAVTAASSTVGPIIPPSLPMIIVGTLTGLSVGKLFLAGAIPGILLGLGMMLLTYIISVKRKYPIYKRSTFKEIMKAFIGAIWALLMTAIILFGIIGGFFTPTEASIVAVIYALFVGFFIYKGLTLKLTFKVFVKSAVTTSSIMLLVGFANLFAWILTNERVPQMISELILGISDNKYVVILLMNIILLFVGMFMETIAALLILFPTLLGVAIIVGIDPIHFGVMAVLNLMIGLTTPPIGVCLFVASSIAKISVYEMTKSIYPSTILNIFVLMLVAYIPAISMWLPSLFYK